MKLENVLGILYELRNCDRDQFFDLGTMILSGRKDKVVKKYIRLVEHIVLGFYNTTPDLLKTNSKVKEIVEVRFIIWYFLKKYYYWITTIEIGIYYNKSHSNICQGRSRVVEWMETNKVFKNKVEKIENEISLIK